MAAVLADCLLADTTIATISVRKTKKFTKHLKIYTNGNPTLVTTLLQQLRGDGGG